MGISQKVFNQYKKKKIKRKQKNVEMLENSVKPDIQKN